MSRKPMNPSRRFAGSGTLPFIGSLHSKSRASPFLSIGLLIMGAMLLIGYSYSGSGSFGGNKQAVSRVQGDFSCTAEVHWAIPFLKKAYVDSMHKVLHVGPDSCSIVSKLIKEEETEAWGVEPYDIEEADSNCKSLVHKGIVRVADIKFPLPYRAKSFSLVIVSDALDYLSPNPLPCSCDEVNESKVVHYGHVVESGSSVAEIAEKYGTTEETLLELNNITDPKNLKAGDVLDVPLKACTSVVKNTSLDYPLLLSNGTYAYTANNCVKCQCYSANNWTLQCEQSGLNITNGTCPSMECGSSGLSIGNSTSTTCNRTTCAYAGYTNQTIFTSLVESTCSSTNNAPSYASKITLPSWRWNFVFIVSQLVMLYLHHSQ